MYTLCSGRKTVSLLKVFPNKLGCVRGSRSGFLIGTSELALRKNDHLLMALSVNHYLHRQSTAGSDRVHELHEERGDNKIDETSRQHELREAQVSHTRERFEHNELGIMPLGILRSEPAPSPACLNPEPQVVFSRMPNLFSRRDRRQTSNFSFRRSSEPSQSERFDQSALSHNRRK